MIFSLLEFIFLYEIEILTSHFMKLWNSNDNLSKWQLSTSSLTLKQLYILELFPRHGVVTVNKRLFFPHQQKHGKAFKQFMEKDIILKHLQTCLFFLIKWEILKEKTYNNYIEVHVFICQTTKDKTVLKNIIDKGAVNMSNFSGG